MLARIRVWIARVWAWLGSIWTFCVRWRQAVLASIATAALLMIGHHYYGGAKPQQVRQGTAVPPPVVRPSQAPPLAPTPQPVVDSIGWSMPITASSLEEKKQKCHDFILKFVAFCDGRGRDGFYPHATREKLAEALGVSVADLPTLAQEMVVNRKVTGRVHQPEEIQRYTYLNLSGELDTTQPGGPIPVGSCFFADKRGIVTYLLDLGVVVHWNLKARQSYALAHTVRRLRRRFR